MAELRFKAADIWESVLRDCAAAQVSIEVEQYILLDDTIGRRFLTLLRDRAQAGVKVRLLLDRVGSRSVYDHQLVHEIRQLGGEINFYNRIGWANLFTPHSWFPRNHSKTAVIDRHIFHIGSACMADYMADWSEAHLRIAGEIIDNIEQDFDYTADAKASNGYRYLRSKLGHINPIYKEMLLQIRRAKKNVSFVTPYFMPPILLRRAMFKAARRGVEVRLMVAGHSDVPIAAIVGQTYFERMRRKGIKIFLFEPTMLHAKYMVVDDSWAMLGSANLDYLSLLRNREANLVIREKSVVAGLDAHFAEAVAQSRQVDAQFWRNVPGVVKLIGYLGRGLKKVL